MVLIKKQRSQKKYIIIVQLNAFKIERKKKLVVSKLSNKIDLNNPFLLIRELNLSLASTTVKNNSNIEVIIVQ